MVEKIEKNVLTAWERVEIARNPKRKTALDYINEIFDTILDAAKSINLSRKQFNRFILKEAGKKYIKI